MIFSRPNAPQGIKFRGLYSNTDTYVIGCVVVYGGGAYIAIADGSGNLPTDTDYWAPYELSEVINTLGNVDGGTANSVYLPTQNIDGGNANG